MVLYPVGGGTGPVEGCGDLSVEPGALASSAGADTDSAQSILAEQCILALSFLGRTKVSVKTSHKFSVGLDTDIAMCNTYN